MLVKICGITRPDDARMAVACGAGALGFVFWSDSPRFVDPYRARAIVAGLPPFVVAVGVFVNQSAEYINDVATLVGLSAVQLHGDEGLELARAIRRPVIKAIAPCAGTSDGRSSAGGPPGSAVGPAVTDWPECVTLLLDVRDPERRGGTGRTTDWAWAAGVAASRPVVLAGGLTPANVREAIARVRPFGIDVSSGVETGPGVKDHGRLKALFEALHDTNGCATRS